MSSTTAALQVVQPRTRCTDTAYCDALRSKLHHPNAHRPGFAPVRLARPDDPTRTYIAGVAFRTSRNDAGVFLNVCPFCGSDARVRRDPPPRFNPALHA